MKINKRKECQGSLVSRRIESCSLCEGPVLCALQQPPLCVKHPVLCAQWQASETLTPRCESAPSLPTWQEVSLSKVSFHSFSS